MRWLLVAADASEWIAFAAADLRAATVLLADAALPCRIACFHAQQAAEKALKAVLVAEATLFKKTHDVVVLAALVPVGVRAQLAAVDLLVLQPWAVDGRYPGDLPDATMDEATEVVAVASAIVTAAQHWLA